MKLVFSLFLYFHMKGCLWYLVCKSESRWASPTDWVYYSSGNTDYQLKLYSDKTDVA